MKRAAYIGFLFAIAALAAALIGSYNGAFAQREELSFARGQKLNHMLSVCIEKKDALAVLDADAKDGFDAAKAIWDKADGCATVPVQGPLVGRVVKSARVKRGDTAITARVVEIVKDGVVLGYFFTTATVDERNS